MGGDPFLIDKYDLYISYCFYSIFPTFRAPTSDVGYVPNAKYLAYIPHQILFDPIYQMC